jgi:ribose/xylose/arabinose/galactoside ABC-type transport system permease subunit
LLSDNFLTGSNLLNIVRQISVNGIIALGATLVVMSGEIDLSQGSLAALIGCFCAMLMVRGISPIVAILIALMVGFLIGIIMGVAVAFLKVPSFITTLGMMYSLSGAVLLLTNSQPISGLPESFLVLGRGYLGFIPVPVLITTVVLIVTWFMIKFLPFGRYTLAIGENENAARLSGINVAKTRVLIFAFAGLASALGGIVLASRLSSGQPSSGSDLSLQALAAVFIGNASGKKVTNTIAGALIMGLINNGLNLMEVNASWQKVALGLILIGAVGLDVVRNKNKS